MYGLKQGVDQAAGFTVFRGWNGLAGWDWPANVNVRVTADDPATVKNPDIELTIATDAEGSFGGGGLFTIYVDPSGVVRDTSGHPVAGATVTLYRSDDPGGPFVAVPNGSAIMSAGNRTNPVLTGADGLFGWDVAPGYYKVRVEKAGYSAPDGGAFVP